VRIDKGPGVAGNRQFTFTLMRNHAATSIQCTIGPGASTNGCSDTSAPTSIGIGTDQPISVRADETGSDLEPEIIVSWAADYQILPPAP
jgi:hypothetical protein